MSTADDSEKTEPSGISRRGLLGLGVAAAGAAAVGGAVAGAVGTGTAGADPVPGPAWPAAPQGTTLERTLVRGDAINSKGYRRVVAGPGEAAIVRGDLLGGAVRGGDAHRTPLLALGHLTDMHVLDAQSPARIEFLDRFKDPGSPLADQVPFDAAYRPQEMLTAQVAESMVQAINNLTGAPVTGRALDFSITTGDNTDNTQLNELRWQIDILDGAPVRPDSGSTSKWEGVGGKDDYDTAYWHPDGTPFLGSTDKPRGTYGFPTVPGLLNRCRAPFQTSGLRMPWYSVFGNHDGLVQGNAPVPQLFSLISQGVLKVTGLPLGVSPADLLARIAAGDAAALKLAMTLGPAKLVTADQRRRCLTQSEIIKEHFKTVGAPSGHGYTQRNLDEGNAYYTFDQGVVHCIALDTVNQNGYADGSLDSTQFAWLQQDLIANSSRYLDQNGNWVAGGGSDKLIVLFSHHTIDTLTNTIGPGRVTGTQITDLLLRFPNVVLWVNGHTHRNTVRPYARPSGAAVGGGFWEVNTASHVDFPQQARVVELVDNGDGTVSIFGTMLDHAAPESYPTTPTTPLELASLSRELGANDWQNPAGGPGEDGRRGAATDRNVELLVRAPFALS